MKSIALLACLIFVASAIAEDYGDGFGGPRPPGTGLTLDLGGKTTLMCGFLSVEKMGVYGFPDFKINGDMKLWLGRERINNIAELNTGLWSIIIEMPKSLTPYAFRWVPPDGKLIVVPAAVLYPKMAASMPGCQTPEVQPAAPVLRAPL